MKLPRYPTQAEWEKIVALGPGVRMYKDKMTLFYNGEGLYDIIDEFLVYSVEERQSWQVIIILPGVKEIPGWTFRGCLNVKKVIMADSVRRIKEKAFFCCFKLEFVKFSRNLERIGGWAFQRCRTLTSIFIPPSCIKIDVQAFDSCTRLIILGIPPHVQLGERVFEDTAFLETLEESCPFEVNEDGYYVNEDGEYEWYDCEETVIRWIKFINNDHAYALQRLCCSDDPDTEEVYQYLKDNGLATMNLPNDIGITPSQYLAANPYSEIEEGKLIKRYILEMMGEVASNTHNIIPKTTTELDAAESTILRLASELEAAKLEIKELTEKNHLLLHENIERSKELQVVKNEFASLKIKHQEAEEEKSSPSKSLSASIRNVLP